GFDRFVVPIGNASEASLLGRARILAVASLAELVNGYGGSMAVPPLPAVLEMDRPVPVATALHDLGEDEGPPEGRCGRQGARAGGHSLRRRRTPGAATTPLAHCLPGILPPLDDDEAVEVAPVRSLRGELDGSDALDHRPPLEAPHHRSTA